MLFFPIYLIYKLYMCICAKKRSVDDDDEEKHDAFEIDWRRNFGLDPLEQTIYTEVMNADEE